MSDKMEFENGEVEMDAKELIKEHKKLVKVLKSPSHKDDLTEAQRQVRELKSYQRGYKKAQKSKKKD